MIPSNFFHPTAVAIVGAGEAPGRIGSGLYKSITRGFPGAVYCVNPMHERLWGAPCYPSLLKLPEAVSHAVIAVQRDLVPDYVRQCAEKGIENVVVISAGFKETDARGAALERDLTDFCRSHKMALLGPNTLGFLNTSVPYNGTFLPADIAPGGVSVISQSGGVGTALLSSLRDQKCGVAKWAGIGNEAVLDAAAFLEYFAQDPETRAIAVCFEGLRDLPGFLRLAAEVNREKPVVLLRDGKSAVGMQAAASHTGTMAQGSGVMRGLAAQFGLLEASGCRECAVMLKALTTAKPPRGSRAVIVTNTAGPSILAADSMEPAGVQLPQPSQALRDAVDAQGLRLQVKNPADISSNGLNPKNYGIVAETLLASDEYDILLGFFSLNEHLRLPEAQIIRAAAQAGKPAVGCFLCSGEEFLQYGRGPEAAGIPCYYDPQDAAAAVRALVHCGESRRRARPQAPAALTDAQREAVAAFLKDFHGPERVTLPEEAARRLLRLAGVDVAIPEVARTADEAARAASECGYPAALKLHSRKITHKSDVGGVRLDLRDEEALRAAFDEMLPALRALDPDAALTVQPMAQAGFEMIFGAVRAPGAGPLVMAGLGGVWAEALEDTAFRMAPLSEAEAGRMLEELRCAPILRGFRGPALDRAAACELLARLSALLAAFPQLREIDLNPCRVYPQGLAVLDARVVLERIL